mgnify:CR=1 FL=1
MTTEELIESETRGRSRDIVRRLELMDGAATMRVSARALLGLIEDAGKMVACSDCATIL